MVGVTAQADASSLAGVTVDAYARCNAAGVIVSNNSGSDIEVRLYLNDAPAFPSNPWTAVPNGQSKLISGTAPAPGSTYKTVQKGPGNTELPLGTVTYTPPDYCDAFDVTFTDTCDTVTVTVASSYGSDAVFTIAQTDGPTYPVVSDFSVPAGQTKSVDVPITAAIKKLGLFFDSKKDYLAFHVPKGLGNCGPSPTPSSPPPGGLPVTGSNVVPFLTTGILLLLVGTGAVVAGRRHRRA